MLNPSTNGDFIGRVTAPDANYGYGSSKSESAPGANDGTPYTAARANDIFGFQQALMLRSGKVPSGNADTQLVSDALDAMGGILFRGVKYGLTVSVGSNPDYDIDIAAGYIMDDTFKKWIRVSARSKELDSTFVLGNGGGLSSATTLVADQQLYVYAIGNGEAIADIIVADTRANALADAAVVIAGLTYIRRIRCLSTKLASSVLEPQVDLNGFIAWKNIARNVRSLSAFGATTAILVDASLPKGFLGRFGTRAVIGSDGVGYQLLSSTEQTDILPSATAFTTSSARTSGEPALPGENIIDTKVDSNNQIRIRGDISTTTFLVLSYGYVEDYSVL